MVEARFVMTLLKLGSYLTRTGGRLMAQFGISQQQSVILIAVDEQGPVSQKAIRQDLLYERSNVSKAVSQLADMGLVKTRKSRDDGRVVLLETTAKGHKTARACIATHDEWNRSWLEGMTDKQLGRALAVLERLAVLEEDS